jgi:hypothetical protein
MIGDKAGTPVISRKDYAVHPELRLSGTVTGHPDGTGGGGSPLDEITTKMAVGLGRSFDACLFVYRLSLSQRPALGQHSVWPGRERPLELPSVPLGRGTVP